jgi:hypothetical protein
MFRYLLKSKQFRTTPIYLKRTLSIRKLVSVGGRFYPDLDWNKDLFLAYPKPNQYSGQLQNLPNSYDTISNFYTANKKLQRSILNSYNIKTPESYATNARHFVVRPLRHYGGTNFRVTNNSEDYNPQYEYISPLFPKKREYRVIFVFGTPILILRKKPGDNATVDTPWNHTNGSFFQTISSLSECRLQTQTSFFSDISDCPLVQDTHIIAADVLTNSSDYAVCELNFSPAITLPNNLQRIYDHVYSRI